MIFLNIIFSYDKFQEVVKQCWWMLLMVIQFFFSGETHNSAKFSVHLVISAPEIRVPSSALQVWKSSVVLDQLCR